MGENCIHSEKWSFNVNYQKELFLKSILKSLQKGFTDTSLLHYYC